MIQGPYSSEQSINQILQAAFKILSFEKVNHPEFSPTFPLTHYDVQENQPDQLGASVFGSDDTYLKLKDFKLRLPRDPDGRLSVIFRLSWIRLTIFCHLGLDSISSKWMFRLASILSNKRNS